MSDKFETRGGLPVEIRELGDGLISIVGYAAVFGERTSIGSFFDEIIAPGAFTEAVERDDVRFLVNHEGLPIARTASGTLKLSEDARGLRVEAELDGSDPDVKSILPKMKRGDLDKMSFAFKVKSDEWDETTTPQLRTIKKVELVDVAIVTFPAYHGTEIGLRSLNNHKAGIKTRNHQAASKRLSQKVDLELRERKFGR